MGLPLESNSLPDQQGATVRTFCCVSTGVGFQQLLDPVEGIAVDDGLVLAFEPFAAMADFAEIDAVFKKVGEGAVGEGNAAVVF